MTSEGKQVGSQDLQCGLSRPQEQVKAGASHLQPRSIFWGPNSLFSLRVPFLTDGTQHSHRTIFLGEVRLDLCQSHLSTDAWPKFFLLPTPEFPSWKWVGQRKSCLEALLKQRKACCGRAWVRLVSRVLVTREQAAS